MNAGSIEDIMRGEGREGFGKGKKEWRWESEDYRRV